MERTKLDEIVEEEWGAAGYIWDLILPAKRIAERAFRHGAEQAHEEQLKWFTYAHGMKPVDLRDVQPEPAEEKGWRHPYKPPIGVCQIPGCTDPPFEHPVDRRKGQRRQGIVPSDCLQTLDGKRWYGYPGTIIPDRRSGNDRRKAP